MDVEDALIVFSTVTFLTYLIYLYVELRLYKDARRVSQISSGQMSGSKTIDLVIARYKENLEWLPEYADIPFRRIIVYNKGPSEFVCPAMKSPCIVKSLPNVGVCDHTYHYHIVEEYHDLADITIFLPGSANLPNKSSRKEQVIEYALKGEPALFGRYIGNVRDHADNFHITSWQVTDPINRDAGSGITLIPATHRPFGAWFDHYLKGNECPFITYTGLFSLSKDMITKHNIYYYKIFLEQLSHDKYPEAAHYMERAWAALVYPFPPEYFHSMF